MSEPRDLGELSHETFAPLEGETFTLAASEPIELRLQHVHAATPPADGERRTPFSLRFLGPPEPLLEQGVRRLSHPELGVLELFLVPLGRDETATRYEAVFS